MSKNKPLDLEFPQIIPPEYKYVAMNSDGTWFAYPERPVAGKALWINSGRTMMSLTLVVAMPAAPRRRWKETLIKRP